MPNYNSTYTGIQIDEAIARVITAKNDGGIVSTNTLTTTLGSYLLSTTAASTYLSKTDATSMYQPLITAGTSGQFYRGDKIFTNELIGTTPDFRLKSNITTSYAILRFNPNNADSGGVIFINGSERSADGGANTMTIRNDIGDLRLDDNVTITGLLSAQKIMTDRGGYVPCTKMANGNTITDLINEVRYSQGQMGSISISTSTHGVPTGWYNYLYIPHRVGFGGDNMNYGTLLLFYMTSNTGTYYQIHLTNGTINNAISK